MDASLGVYDELMKWASPYLSQCSFACIAAPRVGTGEVQSDELDELAALLPQHVDFEANFFVGGGITDAWPEEPIEEDFESLEAFDVAYEAWYETSFDPKPWLKLDVGDRSVDSVLQEYMKSSINNKLYPIRTITGQKTVVAFGSNPVEKAQVAKHELEHQKYVN